MAKQNNLKKSLIGFEIELFTLDRKGKVTDGAEKLLEDAAKDRRIGLKKECAKNIIEVVSGPHEDVSKSMAGMLAEIQYAVDFAHNNGMLLCPTGAYPGKFTPTMRTDKRYKIQEEIFGKSKFAIAGRCIGFHCHYTLPRGVFDSQVRMLKMLVRSKMKDSLVNSYNTLIAMDPVLTTLMQSSPYYQGERLGKDARMIMYRGGEALDNPHGLYSDFQKFGGLPPYKPTAFDIIDVISNRFDTWTKHLESLGINIKTLSLYGSILATTWNPVKVNPNGTLEQRGMDMNHPSLVLGVGALIKFVLGKLSEEDYAVMPSEIGINEPFKVEGDVVYIPPYPYVRSVLQKESAYLGLESIAVLKYCKRLLKLAIANAPKERRKLFYPFQKMVRNRKTVSDEILSFTAKKGFRKSPSISDDVAAEVALFHAERFVDEIYSTRDVIEKIR